MTPRTPHTKITKSKGGENLSIKWNVWDYKQNYSQCEKPPKFDTLNKLRIKQLTTSNNIPKILQFIRKTKIVFFCF